MPTNVEKVAAKSPDSETVTLWVHIHGPSLCGRVTLTGHGTSLGLSFLICKMGQTEVRTPREPLRTQRSKVSKGLRTHSTHRSGLVAVLLLILSLTDVGEPAQETKWKGGGCLPAEVAPFNVTV